VIVCAGRKVSPSGLRPAQANNKLCCRGHSALAINQASFFLFPPRFGPSVKLDDTVRTASSEPLRIVGPMLVDPDAPSIQVHVLRNWLEARGFAEHERYGGLSILFLGRQKTFLGNQQEVELSVPLDENEIKELYIRFLLTERTPAQWNEWEDLIMSLGTDFGFKIMGPDDYLLACSDFFTLLTTDENFRVVQSHYGWNVDRAT
jgi:hypothetical protein